ncbi:hypothetical protein BP5796_06293 [Coleophoma crateriformis]|uniref:Uncharacterized protein n=1 Tax=Coleophoma crateriformis TaxID=565419 RepID=A0A3D8RXA6_9HELO|nr:hypothetical protein BP5796_06293 [Coleophoma crateriformis]
MRALSSVVPEISSASPKSLHSGSSIGYTPTAWYQFSLRTIILVLLPLLSIAGGYGTMVLGGANGTFPHLMGLLDSENALFPGSSDPLLKSYTGITAIDRQLAVLVLFFAPVVDLSDSPLALFCLFGSGQFAAAWTLLVMESLRMGNKSKLVSYIGTVGFILQNISFAVTIPLYLLLHLFTSPVAKPFPGTHANSVLLVPTLDLAILPFSITLGYIIPTILMTLQFPDVVSTATHQKLIALWQPFPIWTMMIHLVLRSCSLHISKMLTKEDDGNRPPAPQGASYLNMAKHVYRFVLALCMITHLPALLLAALPASMLPASADKLAALASGRVSDVYIPYLPLLSHKVDSFPTGVLTFLQWDLCIGSTALLLWSLLLYRNATIEKTIIDPNTALPSYVYQQLLSGEAGQRQEIWMTIAWKTGVWTLLAGPMGAVVILLWGKDEIVRQKVKQGI